ncbi:MAG: plasmid stabilization protein [Ectothiorhodospiraceae bacterium]|nr:plasmid stabilization protein [Ectothiorhodospiraceae bacterium]
MKVHWTNCAVHRLRHIYEYIAEDSPDIALNVIDRITNRSQ